jgi:hypothetical protein
MTPSEIDPETLRFVARGLNHCVTACPNYVPVGKICEGKRFIPRNENKTSFSKLTVLRRMFVQCVRNVAVHL